jgi:hypothetical protein
MTELFAGDGNPATTTTLPTIGALAQRLPADLEVVLRPFLDHLVPVSSIVAIGCHQLWAENGGHSEDAAPVAGNEAVWLRLVADTDAGRAIVARIPIPPPKNGPGGSRIDALDSLAQRAREFCNGNSCDHLIVLPASMLEEMIIPSSDDFAFRAVVTLSPQDSSQLGDGNVWKLQRTLFDRGLVSIGSVHITAGEAHCFLASDAVRSLRRLGAGSRGLVSMSSLGGDGFANQLFQYAFIRLYALRHGVTATVPAWQGKYLFDLDDPSCADLALPPLRFPAFVNEEEALWDKEEPPIDVDLSGYFQEIPECWRRHRPLLRRMFQLCIEHQRAIDTWQSKVTRSGQRTLVAVHVRRGDYRTQPPEVAQWFRLTPEDWYVAWLRAIWPTLRDPLLFVATDEPDVIRPFFKGFETIAATFGGIAQILPNHIRDFELLRRADYMAICNSSFSRMAAILAHPTQKCFVPSFQTNSFVPYEPWIDPGFWKRFAET